MCINRAQSDEIQASLRTREVGGCLLNYCNFVKHLAEKSDVENSPALIRAHSQLAQSTRTVANAILIHVTLIATILWIIELALRDSEPI